MDSSRSTTVIAALPSAKPSPMLIIRRLHQTILTQDFKAMDLILSPNFSYLSPNGRLSRMEYQTMLKASLEPTTEVKAWSISLTAEADRIVDEIELSFSLNGDVFVGRYCSVCAFEDGLLYEMRTYGGMIQDNNSGGYQRVWQRA